MTQHDKFSELRKRAENFLLSFEVSSIPHSIDEIRNLVHELDTHRIELELQNDELLSTQAYLQEVFQDYHYLYNFAPVAYITLGDDNRILNANNTLATLLGVTKQDLLNQPFTGYVPDSDQDILYLYRQALLDNQNPGACELRLRNHSGQIVWVKCEGFFKNISSMNEINLTLTDITLLKNLEVDLRLGAAIFDESVEGIMIAAPDLTILKVNPAFSTISGYSAAEAIGKKTNLLQSGRQDASFYQAMWAAINEYHHWQGEIWNKRKNGEIYQEWLSITARKNSLNETTLYFGVFADITVRKNSDARIHFMAFYDALTELPNRTLLQERVNAALTRSRRNGYYHALMMLDLDHFKVINDSLGHVVGDKLLIEAARRLTASIREEDTVSRLGGDEFVVLLQELSKDREGAELKAAHVAEKICKKLEEPVINDNQELHISVSIGIMIFSSDSEDFIDLIKNADNALYKAKDAGRNNYQFFTSEMKHHANSRLIIENQLHHAVERGELELYYQPQIDIQRNCICGAEVLLRWHHADKGLVLPVYFIPIAEQTGLIIPIGIWVMRTACLQLAAWNKAELAKSIEYIAVNVSPHQFQQQDFVDSVINIVTEAGIQPNQLELELTEGVLMQNIDVTLEKLQALKAFGVRIAIDDFGTGYSSLNYLKRFPLDVLKIDQSFVRDITTDPSDAAIVQTIIALANNLQLRVMAEGVETEAQLAFLRERSCDKFQGYLCSPPVTKEAFIALLENPLPDSTAHAFDLFQLHNVKD